MTQCNQKKKPFMEWMRVRYTRKLRVQGSSRYICPRRISPHKCPQKNDTTVSMR